MLSSILFSNPIVTGITGASYIMSCAAYLLYYFHYLQQLNTAETPVSVNYHFTRRCNYECGFFFHTEKTSSILSPDEAKRGVKLLRGAGMKKLNFAGGEPFLIRRFGSLIYFYPRGLPFRIIVPPEISVTFVFGPPRAGKSTLSALLTENFPVQRISIGDLLRRIKKESTT
ncbi:hypothetical protein ACEPPN_010888 [Leptodophora sp. 'Broadleaf-Isolate-01']